MSAHRTTRIVGAIATTVVLIVGCTSTSDDSGDAGAGNGDTSAIVAAPFDGTYRATIQRTTDGVPHITAANSESATYGQGYASAEDYACTLADQIIKVKSQRAELEGPGVDNANVDSDFAWKAIGIDRIARTDYPDQPIEVRSQMEAFAAGWNKALADTAPDAVSGWCAGQGWLGPITPEDLYAYVRSIPLNASGIAVSPYLGDAQPPTASAASYPTDASDAPAAPITPLLQNAPMASNGWAIGSERSTSGGGLLLANPHFPWEGQLRFWEVHLTVPGEQDIYGAQLTGVPGVGIGFTDAFAWTHTVSAGNRFTAYTLDLVPGEPTSYLVDGEARLMTSSIETVRIKGADGAITTEERTLWASEYGPILDFPGVGWTDTITTTYRDANIDNDEFVAQYNAIDHATTFDEFKAAIAEHQAIPLFNTVAVNKDGEAWYADASATPNLSDEALVAYDASVQAGGIAAIAADNGVILLDGSKSINTWEEVPGARDPGLVPFDEMPQTERHDYVFNANDSFWLNNATTTLDGSFSPLHGRQDTARSPRTRNNAAMLGDVSPTGGSGADGTFDLAEIEALALHNEGYTAAALKDEVVERCRTTSLVDVPALLDDDGAVALPAESVDLAPACAVLAEWDSIYDLDRVGPPLWREFISRYTAKELTSAGTLWAQPFDPADPVNTPSGLAAAPATGPDPTLVNLGRAVQIITKAGFTIDTPLGQLQQANRNDVMVPIHGGTNADGVTNVVGYQSSTGSTEPYPKRPPAIAPQSTLTTDGYVISNGTSFLMAVSFTPEGPVAQGLITYGETEDRTSPLFVAQTQRFSDKSWRDFLFTPEAIAADPNLTTEVVSST